MINDLLNRYIELNFKVYAHIVGYLYIAPVYLVGLIIPQFKKTIEDYERGESNNPTLIISFFSGAIIFGFTLFIAPEFAESNIEKLLWYLGYVGWGFFALYLLVDYRNN